MRVITLTLVTVSLYIRVQRLPFRLLFSRRLFLSTEERDDGDRMQVERTTTLQQGTRIKGQREKAGRKALEVGL